MVHSGAIIAAGVSQGKSTTLGFDTRFSKFQVTPPCCCVAPVLSPHTTVYTMCCRPTLLCTPCALAPHCCVHLCCRPTLLCTPVLSLHTTVYTLCCRPTLLCTPCAVAPHCCVHLVLSAVAAGAVVWSLV